MFSVTKGTKALFANQHISTCKYNSSSRNKLWEDGQCFSLCGNRGCVSCLLITVWLAIPAQAPQASVCSFCLSFLQNRCGCLRQSNFLEAVYLLQIACECSVMSQKVHRAACGQRPVPIALNRSPCLSSCLALKTDCGLSVELQFLTLPFFLFLLRNGALPPVFLAVSEMCMELKQCLYISHPINYTGLSGGQQVNIVSFLFLFFFFFFCLSCIMHKFLGQGSNMSPAVTRPDPQPSGLLGNSWSHFFICPKIFPNDLDRVISVVCFWFHQSFCEHVYFHCDMLPKIQFQKCVLVLRANQMSKSFGFIGLLSDSLVDVRMTIYLGQDFT